jgi:hypothetical protein
MPRTREPLVADWKNGGERLHLLVQSRIGK